MKQFLYMLLLLSLLFPTIALAQSDCDESQELDNYRLLRRLSLDLREQIPSIEEYEDLEGSEDIPESLLDTWLASDEFLRSMRHHHEALLWPNPSEGSLTGTEARIVTMQGGGIVFDEDKIYKLLSAGRTKGFRGDSGLSCKDVPQSEYGYDENGRPNYEVLNENGPGPKDDERQEGYELVTPYWDPDIQLKVCAFDAQAFPIGINGTECDKVNIQGGGPGMSPGNDPGCGCGPNLRWCYGDGVEQDLWEAMREQFGEMVDWVTSGQKPYTELIQGTTVPMNGRLDYWKRHMAALISPTRTINHHVTGEPDLIEDPDYMDLEWRETTTSNLRVGVQTLPAFMLRFQTNRARANRFRIVFTGQYFIPPEQPELASETGCEETTPDVTQQCTCRYCHQVLEPLAQYWGGFFEAGSVQNTDLEVYISMCDPREYEPGGEFGNQDAEDIPLLCTNFYATSIEDKNPGWLYTHQHIVLDNDKHDSSGIEDPLHQSMGDNLFKGPIGYADEVINSGQFATATVRHLFQRLMKRPINLDPTDPQNETPLLLEWSEAFKGEWNYDFPSLAKAMVQHPIYRRVR